MPSKGNNILHDNEAMVQEHCPAQSLDSILENVNNQLVNEDFVHDEGNCMT